MRILHVIPSLSRRRGGPSASLRQLVAAQLAAGLEVGILTSNDDCETNASYPLGRWFELDGVPVMAFERRQSRFRWYREHIVCPDAIRWLEGQREQWQLLHVHAVFSYLSTHAMRMARRLHWPYICRPLGQLCSWSMTQKSLKKQLYLRLLERANLAGASRMHFTSEKEKTEFSLLGIEVPLMVVPHGVQLPDLTADDGAGGELNLLSMSRIDGKKGLDLLLQAFALVIRELPDAMLVIAGDGDSKCISQLQLLASQLGLGERVHFSGWVDGEAKDDLLRRADIFALASHSENFGVAVVEAMAWSVPVLISSGVALCGDVLAANAGEEIQLDPQHIASRILGLGRDSARRARMGRNARALVTQRFVWPEVAATLRREYREIVGGDAS